MNLWKRIAKAIKNLTLICFGVLSCHKEVEVIIRIESPENSSVELEDMTSGQIKQAIEQLEQRLEQKEQ